MRRTLTILAVLLATSASAQDPPKAAPKAGAPAAPAPPSPGERCLVDLPQWQTYAGNLKASRDTLEQELAATKVRLDLAQRQLAEAEKKGAPKP